MSDPLIPLARISGVLLNSPGDTRTPTSHVIHRLELHSAPRISSVWLTVHSAALLLSFDSTLQAHSDQVWLSVGIAFFGFYLAYLAVPYAALP